MEARDWFYIGVCALTLIALVLNISTRIDMNRQDRHWRWWDE